MDEFLTVWLFNFLALAVGFAIGYVIGSLR